MQDLLGPRVFTPREKLEAVEREIGMRRKVYPRWVLLKKIRQDTADREIAVLEAIAEDYRGKA